MSILPCVDARSYGLVNDPQRVQTAAFRAFISACRGTATNQYRASMGLLPPWRVKIDDTLDFEDMAGFVLQGCGHQSGWEWVGSDPTIPSARLLNCRNFAWQDFSIAPLAYLAVGIQQYSATGGHVTSTRNVFRNLSLDGGGLALGVGFLMAGGTGSNTEFNRYADCEVGPVREAAWSLHGWECYKHLFDNCSGYGGGAGVTPHGLYCEGATCRWDGGSLGNVTSAVTLANADAGGGCHLTDLVSEGAGILLDASAASYQVTLRHVRYAANSIAPAHILIDAPDCWLNVTDSIFGVGGDSSVGELQIRWAGNGKGFVLERNQFVCADPVGAGPRMFPLWGPTTARDNLLTSQQPPYAGAMLPEGFPQTLYATDYPGPWMVRGTATLVRTQNTTPHTIDHFTENPPDYWRRYQQIQVLVEDANTTFAPGGNLRLPGNVPLTPAPGAVLTCLWDGAMWRVTHYSA